MSATNVKLAVMMFLEFFIWGAWYPLIFGYLPSLGFGPWEQFFCVAAFNISALVALFFQRPSSPTTQLCPPEKFVAFSHLVGGVAMLGLYFVRKPEDQPSANFPLFFALMLVHTLLYVPTISITNSIAFANLKDPQKQFGPIRLFGTIGWILASLPFVFVLVDWDKVSELSAGKGTIEWLGIALSTAKTGDAFRQASSFSFLAAGTASLALAAFQPEYCRTRRQSQRPGVPVKTSSHGWNP